MIGCVFDYIGVSLLSSVNIEMYICDGYLTVILSSTLVVLDNLAPDLLFCKVYFLTVVASLSVVYSGTYFDSIALLVSVVKNPSILKGEFLVLFYRFSFVFKCCCNCC